MILIGELLSQGYCCHVAAWDAECISLMVAEVNRMWQVIGERAWSRSPSAPRSVWARWSWAHSGRAFPYKKAIPLLAASRFSKGQVLSVDHKKRGRQVGKSEGMGENQAFPSLLLALCTSEFPAVTWQGTSLAYPAIVSSFFCQSNNGGFEGAWQMPCL